MYQKRELYSYKMVRFISKLGPNTGASTGPTGGNVRKSNDHESVCGRIQFEAGYDCYIVIESISWLHKNYAFKQ